MNGHRMNVLADHLERIAVLVSEGKQSRRPDLDARFLLIAADAMRTLGEQVMEIAKIGHELEARAPDTSSGQSK